ncbi:MAG TPA: enoyl-CoA hydratase/isomerase family protein [Burkholderiales bacterium]|jgi:enoyl-CoA hydratase/carnithine racemase
MAYQHLQLAIDGRLAVVRLHRPAQRNALANALMRELITVARELGDRADVDAAILTGSDSYFSAGADLKDASSWDDPDLSIAEQREMASLGYRMCKAWEEMPQITIAAIEGYAIGGGFALTLALDWRVAAVGSFVALPEISLGIPLTWGTIPRLVNLLGPARAKRMTILCERFSAKEALDWGVLDYLAPKGRVLARATELAQQALAMPGIAVRMSKESVNAAATALNHAAGYMAHDQRVLMAGSKEAKAARAKALPKAKKS